MRSYWWPNGANADSGRKRPNVGDIVAHDFRPWRVMDVRDSPLQDGEPTYYQPYMLHLRPAHLDTWQTAMNEDKHGRVVSHRWPILDEHYPVCVKCGDLTPCREVTADKTAAASIERASRYETAGVCPACEEVVTHRQKSITWQQNMVAILGPPVTFHLRSKCWHSAWDYERSLLAQDPNVKRRLHCGGHLTNHGDGTYECSNGVECPGPSTWHQSMRVCECHRPHVNGCEPGPLAVNRADTEDAA
jgi:hypothetical protein